MLKRLLLWLSIGLTLSIIFLFDATNEYRDFAALQREFSSLWWVYAATLGGMGVILFCLSFLLAFLSSGWSLLILLFLALWFWSSLFVGNRWLVFIPVSLIALVQGMRASSLLFKVYASMQGFVRQQNILAYLETRKRFRSLLWYAVTLYGSFFVLVYLLWPVKLPSLPPQSLWLQVRSQDPCGANASLMLPSQSRSKSVRFWQTHANLNVMFQEMWSGEPFAHFLRSRALKTDALYAMQDFDAQSLQLPLLSQIQTRYQIYIVADIAHAFVYGWQKNLRASQKSSMHIMAPRPTLGAKGLWVAFHGNVLLRNLAYQRTLGKIISLLFRNVFWDLGVSFSLPLSSPPKPVFLLEIGKIPKFVEGEPNLILHVCRPLNRSLPQGILWTQKMSFPCPAATPVGLGKFLKMLMFPQTAEKPTWCLEPVYGEWEFLEFGAIKKQRFYHDNAGTFVFEDSPTGSTWNFLQGKDSDSKRVVDFLLQNGMDVFVDSKGKMFILEPP